MRTLVNHSEVARLREQIEREYAAACAGLCGLSVGSARHDFIQKRMERVGKLSEQLIEQMGQEGATPLIVAAMEAGSRQGQQERSTGEHALLSFPSDG